MDPKSRRGKLRNSPGRASAGSVAVAFDAALAGGIALALATHQLLDQVTALRLIAQMPQHQRGGFVEALLEAECFLHARGDAIATRGQVVLERVRVALQLFTQLLDLLA